MGLCAPEHNVPAGFIGAAGLGKIPTTRVRRRISRFSRSRGLVELMRTSGLSAGYRGVTAVQGVDLSVASGEVGLGRMAEPETILFL